MPVQDYPGDAGLDGDVVQSGGGESAACERRGRGSQDLLASLQSK